MEYLVSGPVFFQRFFSTAIPALLITGLLLILMQRLVAIEIAEVDEIEPPKFGPIHHEDVKIVDMPSTKPEKPMEPADTPIDPPDTGVTPDNEPFSFPTINVDVGKTKGNFEMAGAGVPIGRYITAAKYPNVAARRGIEGYVDVRFDVTAAGATANIQVIGADPKGIFEKSALKAVARWRYQPYMENGKAEYFSSIRKRIRFEMEKG